MTHEAFAAAVAAATTGADLDALELQMIASGHAHDAPLRQSVAQKRALLGDEPGEPVLAAHRAHLTARAEMAERLAKDPQLPGAERPRELRSAGKSTKAQQRATQRHAEATAVAKKHYAEAAKAAKAALAAPHTLATAPAVADPDEEED
jgi:hypothetical protein